MTNREATFGTWVRTKSCRCMTTTRLTNRVLTRLATNTSGGTNINLRRVGTVLRSAPATENLGEIRLIMTVSPRRSHGVRAAPHGHNSGFILRIWHVERQKVSSLARRRLGKVYDVSKELGRGSYATVKMALHRKEGIQYAVKLLGGKAVPKTRRRGSRTAPNSFKIELGREVEILKALQHDHIVQFKEHFVEDDGVTTSTMSDFLRLVLALTPFLGIVLELVSGGDLEAYLARYTYPLRKQLRPL